VTRSLANAQASDYFDSGAFLVDLTGQAAFRTEPAGQTVPGPCVPTRNRKRLRI